MFKIYRNGSRVARSHSFSTYEQARQWVRKQLRKLVTDRSAGQPPIPFAVFGYEIRAA